MRLDPVLHAALLLSPCLAHTTLTPYEQISQTLSLYPLAVDFKNPSLFPSVFTTDAVANYTGPLSNLTGLAAIRDALLQSVASLATQHQLGTTVIDIHDDGQTANSTTYVTATLISTDPATSGDFTILYGLYADELVQGNAGWRIRKRDLVFMTPTLGNRTLG